MTCRSKFALFESDASRDPPLVCKGEIEGIGTAPHFRAVDAAGHPLAERRWLAGKALAHEVFLAELYSWIESHRGEGRIVAAGHRVVHGGTVFSEPVLINDGVLAALDRLVPLAPLHQPHNLVAIRALRAIRPALPQIACFDTAFHHELPRDYEAAGVRRYGFHGLSYEFIAAALTMIAPEIALGRVVIAHLGNGASLCALRGGRSVAAIDGSFCLESPFLGIVSAEECV